MITKKDLLAKCESIPGVGPLRSVLSSRDFTPEELEAFDYTLELFITMQETISHLNDILITKLQIWLASIKDKG